TLLCFEPLAVSNAHQVTGRRVISLWNGRKLKPRGIWHAVNDSFCGRDRIAVRAWCRVFGALLKLYSLTLLGVEDVRVFEERNFLPLASLFIFNCKRLPENDNLGAFTLPDLAAKFLSFFEA